MDVAANTVINMSRPKTHTDSTKAWPIISSAGNGFSHVAIVGQSISSERLPQSCLQLSESPTLNSVWNAYDKEENISYCLSGFKSSDENVSKEHFSVNTVKAFNTGGIKNDTNASGQARKLRNREHAKRSRQRANKEREKLIETINSLEKLNMKLMQDIESMKMKIDVVSMLTCHRQGGKKHKLWNSKTENTSSLEKKLEPKINSNLDNIPMKYARLSINDSKHNVSKQWKNRLGITSDLSKQCPQEENDLLESFRFIKLMDLMQPVNVSQ